MNISMSGWYQKCENYKPFPKFVVLPQSCAKLQLLRMSTKCSQCVIIERSSPAFTGPEWPWMLHCCSYLYDLRAVIYHWQFSQIRLSIHYRLACCDSWGCKELGHDWARREWLPIPLFLPGEFHGQRSLAGYSSWGPQKVRHDWVTNTSSPNIFIIHVY